MLNNVWVAESSNSLILSQNYCPKTALLVKDTELYTIFFHGLEGLCFKGQFPIKIWISFLFFFHDFFHLQPICYNHYAFSSRHNHPVLHNIVPYKDLPLVYCNYQFICSLLLPSPSLSQSVCLLCFHSVPTSGPWMCGEESRYLGFSEGEARGKGPEDKHVGVYIGIFRFLVFSKASLFKVLVSLNSLKTPFKF